MKSDFLAYFLTYLPTPVRFCTTINFQFHYIVSDFGKTTYLPQNRTTSMDVPLEKLQNHLNLEVHSKEELRQSSNSVFFNFPPFFYNKYFKMNLILLLWVWFCKRSYTKLIEFRKSKNWKGLFRK